MNKVVPIALVLAVVLIVVFVTFLHGGGPTTTVVTTTVSANTTTLPATTSAQTTTISGYNGVDCLSPNATEGIPNGNFSTGTYQNWTASGLGFGTAPSNITYDNEIGAYYGQKWTGYNGVFFATSYNGGTSVAPGNITSEPFVVTEPYINFKVISPQNNAIYVQILKNGTPEVTVHYDTYKVPLVNATNTTTTFSSESNFVNASIIMIPLLCSKVQIKVAARVVGGATGNQFNYIAVTDFHMSKKPWAVPGIIVNQSLNYT